MTSGKRHNTSEPLTEHDVAERLARSALRTWRILAEAREMGIAHDVRTSRFLPGGLLDELAAELERWESS